MVRSIAGQGRLITRYPPVLAGTDWPSRVTTSAAMPGRGRVAEPGLVGVAPDNGVIMMAPVSVCHQVSTMGQRSLPMTRWYHIQASGLIGSPTVPSKRNDVSLCLRGHCSPALTKA